MLRIKASQDRRQEQHVQPLFAPPEDPYLTVIMVSYNTRELTLAALRTLFDTTRKTPIHVAVLDNASFDGSADAVAESLPQVRLIRFAENLGFARANNVVAAEASTEFLLLLNPDTECHEGAVDNLMAFALAHPQAGIWGGRTVFPDGSLNIGSCWQRITPWSVFCLAVGLTAAFPRSNIFNTEALGSWKRDTVREVDIVSGCFFLIRRDLWAQLGGFDLRYFMYGEEADLCLRARRLGSRPMITPEAEIMHLVGASSIDLAGKRLMLTKARVTLIRDHWPAWQVPFGIGLMWLWAAVRLVASQVMAPLRGEKGQERASYWAEVWGKRRDWLRGY
jgi:GT2 family glycosyltransferase